jgi:superfamily II DNA or RNA helicase
MKLMYVPRRDKSIIVAENNDELKIYKKLCNVLTAQLPYMATRNYRDWDGKVCFIQDTLYDSGLYFIIKAWLTRKGIHFDNEVLCRAARELKINDRLVEKLWPIQKEMVQYIHDHYMKYGFTRLIMNTPVGSGKSFVIENLSRIFPGTTNIVLVEGKSLCDQYISEKGANDMAKNGLKEGMLNACMAGFYVDTLTEIMSSMKRVDWLVLDEVHLERVKNTAMLPVAYLGKGVIGFTATLPDDAMNKMNLFGKVSSCVFTKTFQDIYKVTPKVFMFRNPTVPDRRSRVDYIRCYRTLMVDRRRLGVMLSVVKKYKNKKIIIVVDKIEDNMRPLLEFFHKHNINCGHVYGQTPMDERKQTLQDFTQGKINPLIASSVFKAGINIPQADIIIVNAAYDSSVPVIQFTGRMIRGTNEQIQNKIIIDFMDLHYKFFRKQSKSRAKTYKSCGWDVKFLEII